MSNYASRLILMPLACVTAFGVFCAPVGGDTSGDSPQRRLILMKGDQRTDMDLSRRFPHNRPRTNRGSEKPSSPHAQYRTASQRSSPYPGQDAYSTEAAKRDDPVNQLRPRRPENAEQVPDIEGSDPQNVHFAPSLFGTIEDHSIGTARVNAIAIPDSDHSARKDEALPVEGMPQTPPSTTSPRTFDVNVGEESHSYGSPQDRPAYLHTWEFGLVHVLSVLLGGMLVLFGLVVWLHWCLRRLAGKIQPTIRVEMAEGGLPLILSTGADSRLVHSSWNTNGGTDEDKLCEPPQAAMADFGEEAIPLQLFGTTYDERKQAEALRQQEIEAAILEEILEDNLQLQSRLVGQLA